MATHSSILAWRIPRTEEPDRLQSIRVTESQTQLSVHAHIKDKLHSPVFYLQHIHIMSKLLDNF